MPAQRNQGFTLIELLVVMAIIAILATVGLVVYSGIQKSARNSKRIQDLKNLQIVLEGYRNANGTYPVTSDPASFQCLSSIASQLVPNYMATIPKDPFEDENGTYCYMYRSNGSLGTSANEYKVRTNPSIGTGELGAAELQQQPSLLDPGSDGTPDCIVQNDAQGKPMATRWAVSVAQGSGLNNACAW